MTSDRHPQRDIVWILAIKFAGLALLRFLFFSPSDQPPTDAAATALHLVRTPVNQPPARMAADLIRERLRD